MTKTIEEQIEEARDDLAYARESYYPSMAAGMRAAHDRAVARAASRLATLEAVRDGRMVPVYATVSADDDARWVAYGAYDLPHDGEAVSDTIAHYDGNVVTVLRGYAHVPSTQVHEVEADSEVPS